MKFKELPDGSKFRVKADYESGLDIIYVKDSDTGICIRTDNPNQTIRIADDIKVIEAT